jgi:hypothetical protein
MQTISGIHYNWSLPGVDNDQYFALIRNFRRHAFLLLYLLGASPAVCPASWPGAPARAANPGRARAVHAARHVAAHGAPGLPERRPGLAGGQLQQPGRLRRLAARRADAALPGLRGGGHPNPGGDYNQLATTLLQIENEFYGTIRPKRVIFPGERPLHALRERGVEYVEVRLMDLDPFEPIGITAQSLRLLDVFLLHCLLADSPPDTPQEIAELKAQPAPDRRARPRARPDAESSMMVTLRLRTSMTTRRGRPSRSSSSDFACSWFMPGSNSANSSRPVRAAMDRPWVARARAPTVLTKTVRAAVRPRIRLTSFMSRNCNKARLRGLFSRLQA